jgi:hypothetical protein
MELIVFSDIYQAKSKNQRQLASVAMAAISKLSIFHSSDGDLQYE